MQSRIVSDWAATLSSTGLNIYLSPGMPREQEVLVWLIMSNNPTVNEFVPKVPILWRTDGASPIELRVTFTNPIVKFQNPDKPNKPAQYFMLDRYSVDGRSKGDYAQLMSFLRQGVVRSASFGSKRSFRLADASSSALLRFKSRLNTPLILKFGLRSANQPNQGNALIKVLDRRPDHEFQMSKMMPHLRMKRPFFVESNRYYLAMRKVGHIDLLDLINEILRSPDSYSPKMLAYLSQAIISALDSQVHQKGCVHRDINEANIRVTKMLVPPYFSVTFIDLEMSKPMPTPQMIATGRSDYYECLGTRVFAAPENWRNSLTSFKSDLFACMKLLWIVWCGPKRAPKREIGQVMADMPPKQAFFFGMRSITEYEKDVVYRLFVRSHVEDMAARPTAAEIIAEFDKIINPPTSAPRPAYRAKST